MVKRIRGIVMTGNKLFFENFSDEEEYKGSTDDGVLFNSWDLNNIERLAPLESTQDHDDRGRGT